MTEERKDIMLLILPGTLIMIAVILYLLLTYRNSDTLTFGIYVGNRNDLPGTKYYQLYDRAIDKFHEKYPNIKVSYQEGVTADDYSDWLASQILKGEGPDIFLIFGEDYYKFQELGILENLNSFIIRDDDFVLDRFYEGQLELGKTETIQYALPFECNPKMMFINRTLLEEQGIDLPSKDWTWDDFYEICEKIEKDVDGDGKNEIYPFYNYSWIDAVYSNGITPFSEDGKECNFTDEKLVEAVQFVKKLNELNENYQVTSADFDLGNVVFYPLSFEEYRTYKPYPWKIKKFTNFNLDCLTMPAGPDGDNRSLTDTIMVAMNEQAKNKAYAWEMIKILTMDEEIQYYIFEDTAGISPLKEVTRSEKVINYLNGDLDSSNLFDMELIDMIQEKTVVEKRFSGYESVMEYANRYIKELLESDDDMNLALYELHNNIYNMLRDR